MKGALPTTVLLLPDGDGVLLDASVLQLFVVLDAVIVAHERHARHVHEGHDPGAHSPELHGIPGRTHRAAELRVDCLFRAGGRESHGSRTLPEFSVFSPVPVHSESSTLPVFPVSRQYQYLGVKYIASIPSM